MAAKLPQELAQLKAGVEGYTENPPMPDLPGTGVQEINPNLPSAAETVTGFEENIPSPEEFGEETPEPRSSQTSFEQPMPSAPRGGSMDEERIHEIAEAVLNEKWDEFMSQTGNIILWKDRVNNEIISMKQEIIRVSQRVENLQNAIIGKVKEYGDDMKNIHTEMRALEKVFEKILEPLTDNIKELSKITEDLKLRRK